MPHALAWASDRTKRVSRLRFISQLLFLFVMYYVSIVAVWKGLLLALIIGVTAVAGRFFCGWICPFGFYMDITTSIRKLLKLPHYALPVKLNSALHKLRYVILLVVLLLAVPPFLLGTASLESLYRLVFLRSPFNPYTILIEPLQTPLTPWVPPFGALFAFDGQSISYPYAGEFLAYITSKDVAWVLAFSFVVLTLAASFAVRRVWCRFCPTGVSIAALNRFKHLQTLPPLHIDKEEEKCTKCGICKRVCPVEVTEVYEQNGGKIKTSMCTLCLRCIEMCPYKGCLKLKMGKTTIMQSRNWLETQTRSGT
ncbi:MAG: 4Fe-4S binding protein [Candidatus Bathyarchaeota archaeon]|nr:4Fe-4S binding protein [Candidatus Bathyarchaeota archaeon]